MAPEVFDAVDVVMSILNESIGMVDPIMMKFGDVQDVVDTVAICIDY